MIYIYIHEIRDKYSTYDTCEMLYTADSYICIYIYMIYMIYVVFIYIYIYEIYVI